jgi:hypothetical protein
MDNKVRSTSFSSRPMVVTRLALACSDKFGDITTSVLIIKLLMDGTQQYP